MQAAQPFLLRGCAAQPALRLRRRAPPARRASGCAASAVAPPSLAALAQHYGSEGWVAVAGVLTPDEVAALQAASDALTAGVAALEASERRGGVYYEVQTASGRKREPAVAPGVLRKITNPSARSPPFAALREHPRVLRLAAALSGVAAPVCVVDQVTTKAGGGVGTGFPWHQDASFLFGDAARRLAAHGGVNCVLALDASHARNGGFEVLGRTHAGPVLDLHGRYDASGDGGGLFDEAHRAAPTLAPGDAIFFHPRLAHGSGANTSARARRLATLWFVGGGAPPAADAAGED